MTKSTADDVVQQFRDAPRLDPSGQPRSYSGIAGQAAVSSPWGLAGRPLMPLAGDLLKGALSKVAARPGPDPSRLAALLLEMCDQDAQSAVDLLKRSLAILADRGRARP